MRINYRQIFALPFGKRTFAEGSKPLMTKNGVLKDPAVILEKYGDTVFRAAYALTKNRQDAEDAAQDTFISLMEAAPEFESEEHQKAWLLRVVTNKCKSLFRTVWHSRTQAIAEDYPTAELTVDESGVITAVNNLPLKYKEIVYLHYVEGYTAKEIAQILQMPQNTVLSRMARARKLLKETLKEEG